MHDLIIRDARIVDGSGEPAFNGDIAIDGSVITAVGGRAGRGRREIAANGRLATPGWVDIHTHYDGQVLWDPELSPSGWHGCTTVILGNCGVGVAPARPESRTALIQLMEGVEDIPGIVLTEGLKWNWLTFADYLNAVEATPRTIDVGTQIAHAPLRVFAMGERAARHEVATDEEIGVMCRAAAEALEAGALGMSTSRYLEHRSSDGRVMPGTYADRREITGLLEVLAQHGQAFFQFVSGGGPGETEFLRLAERYADRVPMSMNLQQVSAAPEAYRNTLKHLEKVRGHGGRLYGLVHGRTTGVLLCLDGTLNPFSDSAAYKELLQHPARERLRRLHSPAIRRLIIEESSRQQNPGFQQWLWASLPTCYELGDPPDYEPPPDQRFDHLAEASARSVAEVAYDALLAREGTGIIYLPVMNYAWGNLDATLEMMEHPHCRLGLADGGAHCGFICDVSLPTFMLTHWVRDRTRGRRMRLETAVKIQTLDTAEIYGLRDRGLLKPGYKADVNVIDFDRLTLHAPRMVSDLPGGGRRLIQTAEGYGATLCSGVVAFENGASTGAMPGALIRGRRQAPLAAS